MPTDERRRQLWRLLDQHRGRIPVGDLPSLVFGLEGLGETLDYDDLAYLAQRINRHFGSGAFMPPSYVCRFVAELLAAREAMTVLDPAAGEGWLAARVTSLGRAARVVAVTNNSVAPWLVEKLRLERMTVIAETPSSSFDAVISMPPVFGQRPERRRTPDGRHEVRDDPGLLRMLDEAGRLLDGGLIAWIVPPRFAFNNSTTSVRRNLHHYGLHLSGLPQIPPGAFMPATPMGFELALIERTPHDDLFVAVLPEEVAAQDQLIARLRERSEGPQPSQGRRVREKTFFGLSVLEAVDRAKRLADRRGLVAATFSEVIAEVNRPRPRRPGQPFERLPHHPDAVYLPEMAKTDATTDQEKLPERLQSYLQLIVRRDKADPEYVAGMLNTPLGHAIRESASSGNTFRESRATDWRASPCSFRR